MKTLLGVALSFWWVVLPVSADLLIGTNGERFADKVVTETADTVVFDSELAGRLSIPRSKILEVQRTPYPVAAQPSATNQAQISSVMATNAADSTNMAWRPPGVGLDGSDWISLIQLRLECCKATSKRTSLGGLNSLRPLVLPSRARRRAYTRTMRCPRWNSKLSAIWT